MLPFSPPILGQLHPEATGLGSGGVGGERERGGAREGASCRTFQEPKPIPSGCWRLRAAGDPRETWPHQAGRPSPLYTHPKVHSLPPRRGSLPGQEGACPLQVNEDLWVGEREKVKRPQVPIQKLKVRISDLSDQATCHSSELPLHPSSPTPLSIPPDAKISLFFIPSVPRTGPGT